jgi:hypothetical protein
LGTEASLPLPEVTCWRVVRCCPPPPPPSRDGVIVDAENRFWAARDTQEWSCDEIVDCDNMILAPGFIDIQINGAFHVDFSNNDVTEEDIERVAVGLTKARGGQSPMLGLCVCVCARAFVPLDVCVSLKRVGGGQVLLLPVCWAFADVLRLLRVLGVGCSTV